METEQYLCDLTKQMFYRYLIEPTEENYNKIVSSWAEPFSLIGTGKHEIYGCAETAIQSMTENQREATSIRFEILDEWYEARMIRADIGIVFGGVWVREKAAHPADALVEMDTRFSIVYEREASGEWKMVHIHHSMPYFDQGAGEYYPKELSAKVKEALELVAVFKKKSEMDLMTGVLNHASFQRMVEKMLAEREALYLYIIDLDDFKSVNDTYGHGTGDTLLKFMADILRKHFPDHAVIGRLGGDEFAVCQNDCGGRTETEARLTRMYEDYRAGAREILKGRIYGYSVGAAAKVRTDTTYRQLYEQADAALYAAKKQGKNQFYFLPRTDGAVRSSAAEGRNL
ncbi:diguanylate cyclase [Pseudoflavonifractor sp. BIOML-A6]|jgi:hypothetical protein|nr:MULTISPECIES: diguanylate cyclase [unclassified Pseudoflavonifractor]MTQ97078.1 diguanylate cyclase [Pseudoflavonifractor sp. BIOML-A16]MTR06100.1 diguanylate cyclase [Pseudoflavonifractor sp. BIOML-A15]MTR33709.1 diguanylate cyclase [Pseudoflavonifractor sp. BIOML-A14]MTR72792.1 diguanylate cyclase [Pseudoflavonifractor sp. BIOML-A18]MTS63307.1 diguanylate cyclase [Pseudoflavonifractor sp. BIOML-A5]MTS70884.1 diguanylate cyclase [Pseudoflavonifractor sp. BIOML-A8]MTS90305.1 diguanylate c